MDTLSAHVATFGTGEDGLVFHVDGRPVGRAVASTYIRSAARATGLTASCHDLRHHHASVLLSAGVSPPCS